LESNTEHEDSRVLWIYQKPSGQDAISCEKGRVAAIQFFSDGRTLQTIFPTSQSLQEYLVSASNDEADGEKIPDKMRQPLRCLIILEDLP
jgi:hypothetical protein